MTIRPLTPNFVPLLLIGRVLRRHASRLPCTALTAGAPSADAREQLQLVFGPQAARLGTLHELTKLTPIAIIAEALGYATEIEQHARASATTYTQYVASRHTTTPL